MADEADMLPDVLETRMVNLKAHSRTAGRGSGADVGALRREPWLTSLRKARWILTAASFDWDDLVDCYCGNH